MTSSPDRVEAPTWRSRFVRRFWITLTALTVFLYAVIVRQEGGCVSRKRTRFLDQIAPDTE